MTLLRASVVMATIGCAWVVPAAAAVLPNGKRAEKWEGIAIGPRLKRGDYVILAGNDND